MDLFIWLMVGLVAGALASLVVHDSGFGLLGDIVLGIAGALIGGWGFRALGWRAPFAGTPGVIAVAFIGAVVVLVALRLIARAASYAPRR
jgi:uncharacterized membrane protein YeaQ/YmgE (transglycosylase-associated protein family)